MLHHLALLLVGLALVALVSYALAVAYTYRRLFVPDHREHRDQPAHSKHPDRSGRGLGRGRGRATPPDFEFTPWEFQAEYEDLELTAADGTTFGAWWFRQSSSPQVIIVSPGHKGRRQDVLGISVALWRKGFNVIAYSYRGMAGADSRTVTMGIREVNELQAVVAFARQRIKGARVGLLGYSMGASVSLLGASGEPGVEALVLDSPFADFRQVMRENIRRLVKLPGGPIAAGVGVAFRVLNGVSLKEARPLGALSALEPRPLFFIHGGADAITSVQHSRRLYDAYRGPREIWVVQGAPHAGAYFADRDLYVERVAGFFGRHLQLARGGALRLVEEEEVS